MFHMHIHHPHTLAPMMCVRSAIEPLQIVTQVAQKAQWYSRSEYLSFQRICSRSSLSRLLRSK